MRQFTAIAAFLGAAAFANGAAAQSSAEWYASLSGGAAFHLDSDNRGAFAAPFTTGAGTTISAGTVVPAGAALAWSTEYDVGYAVSGAIGRRYGMLRGEIEVAYQNNNIDSHRNVLIGGGAIGGEDAGVLITGSGNLGVTVADLVAKGEGDVRTVFVMANVFLDIDTGAAIKPYIGAGAGVGFVNVDFRPSAATIIDDNAAKFAWQAMAGASYEVSPMLELFAGYRYRATNRANVTASLLPADLEIENAASIVEAGLRISF